MPRRKRTYDTVAERRATATARRHERERAARDADAAWMEQRAPRRRPCVAPSAPALEAITRYHAEKEASDARNAAKRADERARIHATLARVDAALLDPTTKKFRFRRLATVRIDPRDALLAALLPYLPEA